jgi:hypothetical protein
MVLLHTESAELLPRVLTCDTAYDHKPRTQRLTHQLHS